MRKFFWNTLAFLLMTLWLLPLVAGLADTLSWILIGRGITGIQWLWHRSLVAAAWTVLGFWTIFVVAIYCAEEANREL